MSRMSSHEEIELSSRPLDMPSIQLEQGRVTDIGSGTDSAGAISALPPVDGGRRAWLFLASATAIETIVWGWPYSVGILHQFWTSKLFPQTSSDGVLTIAATLQSGMMYIIAAVYSPLQHRYPQYRAATQATGLALAVCGIVASAFATQPWHLLVTIGMIYPLGGATLYMPAVTLLYQWFQVKRGLASGVMFAGTGFGGTVFPFLMQALLDKFGYRAALISLGVGFGIIGGISLLSIRPRLPIARSTASQPTDTKFLYRSSLYAFSGAILFTSLGNFMPSLYLPAFAASIGLKSADRTALVSAMNAASIPGLLALGYLSDKLPIRLVVSISCGASALACLFLWGFASSFGVLIVFAIVFGFFGLSFTGVWTALVGVVSKDDPHLPATVLGLFTLMRGVGNIASGPISDSLLSHNHLASHTFGASNYGSLLLYTGLMMLVGSGVGVAYKDSM